MNWQKIGLVLISFLIRCAVVAAIAILYYIQSVYTKWTFTDAPVVISILGFFIPDLEKWLESEEIKVGVSTQTPPQS